MPNEQTTTPPAANTPPAPVLGLPADPPAGTPPAAPPAKTDGTTAKTEGEKKAEGTPPAPIELKVPEGFKADEKLVTGFKATAAKLGLDGAKAQELFNEYVGIEKAREAAAEAGFAQQDAAWREEIQKDAEFGGGNFTAAQLAANRALAEFGGKELAGLLAKTGLDNNPAVFRALARIGKRMGEDKLGTNPPPASAPKTLGEALYPDKKE